MDEIEEKFNQYRQQPPALDWGNNFEERVFAKIKRKKKQRKVFASVTLGIVFIGALFVAQATLFSPPAPAPEEARFAQTRPAPRLEKEEIPVVEDVVFASSDARSTYVIEQVGYTPKDNTL
jgi:hypothetical protein